MAAVLFSYALVQSTVMQAAALTPWGAPICAVAGPGSGKSQTDQDHAAGAICAFCAAAAHAPVMSATPPLRAPVCWSWTVMAQREPAPLADPTTLQPKARGPPTAPQDA